MRRLSHMLRGPTPRPTPLPYILAPHRGPTPSPRILAPHPWLQILGIMCKVCPSCLLCTGWGADCCNYRREGQAQRPARLGGQACGCGGGRTGCEHCGMCDSCMKDRPECPGHETTTTQPTTPLRSTAAAEGEAGEAADPADPAGEAGQKEARLGGTPANAQAANASPGPEAAPDGAPALQIGREPTLVAAPPAVGVVDGGSHPATMHPSWARLAGAAVVASGSGRLDGFRVSDLVAHFRSQVITGGKKN